MNWYDFSEMNANGATRGGAELALGVVTFNNAPEQIRQLSKSIELAARGLGDGGPSVLVFTVDNGREAEWPAASFPVERLETAGNVGFGKAMNALMGAAFARPQVNWFVCVNPDGALHHACLRELLAACDAGRPGLVEARQFPVENPKVYDPATLDTPWASGACLLIPRAVREALGGFDPHFFMYHEDVDLSWRARSAGFTVRLSPRALFGHSLLDRGDSPAVEKFMLLSGRYLAHKWGASRRAAQFESELLARGFCASRSELPELPERGALAENVDASVADFDHEFFAPMRW